MLVFVNKQRLAAIFPRNRLLGAIVGSAIGLILPVGQYGTIPVARRFLLEGVPPGVVFSFLTAAPTLNIVTLWLTWQTFTYSSIFFYRSLSVWLMAIFIGTLFSFYREKPRTDSEIPLESSLVLSGSFLPEEKPPVNPCKESAVLFMSIKLEIGKLGQFLCSYFSITLSMKRWN